MTGDRLRELVAQADAGPWWFDGRDIFHKQPGTNLDQIIIPIPSAEETFHPSQAVTPATAKLASLAPDMAVLLAAAIDALELALDCKGPHEGTVSENGGEPAICRRCATEGSALLARFRALGDHT